MILSSKDIYRILRNNPVIDVLARVEIIDGPAPLGNVSDIKEFVVYIQQYPAVSEFEASWRLDIVDLSDDVGDVFIAQLKSALPGFKIKKEGLFIQAEVASLKTSETETRPSPKIDVKQELQGLDARFEELKQDIEDRMLLVAPGRPGKDGAPGRDGKDGKDGIDGKDLYKTDAVLDDLNDVSLETFVDLVKGQVLTWDGAEWTNLFIPQVLSSTTGGSGGTAVATTENCDVHDGGDFDTGTAIAPTCSGLTSTTIVTESTYQVVVSDSYIGVNYNGLVTITMPTGTNNGLKYMIKDESGLAGQPANYITIVGDGTDLIDSESSVIIGFNYGSLTLIWRDGAWRII